MRECEAAQGEDAEASPHHCCKIFNGAGTRAKKSEIFAKLITYPKQVLRAPEAISCLAQSLLVFYLMIPVHSVESPTGHRHLPT